MIVEKIEWYRAIEFLVFIIPRVLIISYTLYSDMVLESKERTMKRTVLKLGKFNAILYR